MHESAVADRQGMSPFTLVPNYLGYSRLRRPTYPEDFATHTIEVRLERHDDTLPAK